MHIELLVGVCRRSFVGLVFCVGVHKSVATPLNFLLEHLINPRHISLNSFDPKSVKSHLSDYFELPLEFTSLYIPRDLSLKFISTSFNQ